MHSSGHSAMINVDKVTTNNQSEGVSFLFPITGIQGLTGHDQEKVVVRSSKIKMATGNGYGTFEVASAAEINSSTEATT